MQEDSSQTCAEQPTEVGLGGRRLRVLIDQHLPAGVARHVAGYAVSTVSGMGWAGLTDGVLLTAAEHDRFDVLVTGDRNLIYQQPLAGRRIAVVVLSTTHWPTLRPQTALVRAAVEEAVAGACLVVTVPRLHP
jgi:predicted nuclease of predicted toxin-antitoxin system